MLPVSLIELVYAVRRGHGDVVEQTESHAQARQAAKGREGWTMARDAVLSTVSLAIVRLDPKHAQTRRESELAYSERGTRCG
jgi:hypothetical protein